jgi:cellulose synthase/poly-beta-1,6-N-acetylglucosamine synthase-like glycosyltransferase
MLRSSFLSLTRSQLNLLTLLVFIHALAALLLALYALHQGILLALFFLKRRKPETHQGVAHLPVRHADALGDAPCRHTPSITVQLPLYNERYVAERIIQACAALDYPRDKLCIQVLDDSTDDTTLIAQFAIEEAEANGLHIELIHRTNRQGYKAGALAEGMRETCSDLVAIFDADFVPPPDFLRKLVCEQRVFDDPQIGFVQTRWGYLNRDENNATRAQAMMLDIHFLIEQPARSNSNLLMAFNGSGGIWRRVCIEDAGGWQADTLTEDLDLSYRAQLRGWRGLFLAGEAVPSELPRDVPAYKQQQARWARGTVQCLLKLMPRVFKSNLPRHKKLFAWLHVSGYIIHPLMLVMMVTTPLLLFTSAHLPGWLGWMSGLSLAPIASMLAAQALHKRPGLRVLRDLPVTLMLGIGVAFSNTASMCMGLFRHASGEFARTPKMRGDTRRSQGAYTTRANWTMWGELALTAYGLVALVAMLRMGYWFSALPTCLYLGGFASVGFSQLAQRLAQERALETYPGSPCTCFHDTNVGVGVNTTTSGAGDSIIVAMTSRIDSQ